MRITMQQQTEQKSLEDVFKEFVRYCKVKNLAEDTNIFYENCIKNFSRFYPMQDSLRQYLAQYGSRLYPMAKR